MTPTNFAELPDVIVDAFGQNWHKSNPDGTAWHQSAPMGARPTPIPVEALGSRAPYRDPDTGRVVIQKPADDLNAAEAWQRKHEDETGHRTWRTNSWSGATGYVHCGGHGLERCTDGFHYRNTRDRQADARD